MPYKFTWEPTGVIKSLYGHVTTAEQLESVDAFYRDARSNSIEWLIVDYSELESHNIEFNTMMVLTSMHQSLVERNPRIKIKMVSKDESLIHMFTENSDTRLPFPYPLTFCPTLEVARRELAN